MLYAWGSQNTAGHTKKLCTTGKALFPLSWNIHLLRLRSHVCRTVCWQCRLLSLLILPLNLIVCSQIVGPLLFTTEEAPYYRRGLIAECVCSHSPML